MDWIYIQNLDNMPGWNLGFKNLGIQFLEAGDLLPPCGKA